MKIKNLLIISLILLSLVLIVSASPYLVDENMNVLGNDIYNVTNVNSTYLYQDNNLVLDISDETNLNVNHSNSTSYINWSGILNKFITAVDNIYVYMSGSTLTINETKLEELNVNSSDYWDNLNSTYDIISNRDSGLSDYGLILSLPANGDFLDYSGYGNDGTETDVTFSTGRFGNSFYFNGSAYIDMGQPNELSLTGNQLTLSAWVNVISLPDHCSIIDKTSGSHTIGYNLVFRGDQTLRITIGNGSVNEVYSDTVNLNEWLMATGTYNGSEICIYVNGNNPVCTNATGDIQNNPASLFIGSRSATDDLCNGYIDDIMIYNRSMTSSEVESLYFKSSEFYGRKSFRGSEGYIGLDNVSVNDLSVSRTTITNVTITNADITNMELDHLSGYIDIENSTISYLESNGTFKVTGTETSIRYDGMQSAYGIMAYYPFAEQSVKDQSGYANDGTATVATWVMTPKGGAYQFAGDAGGTYLVIPKSNENNITGTEITFEAWLYTPGQSTDRQEWLNMMDSGGTTGYRGAVEQTSNKPRCTVRNSSSGIYAEGSTSVPLNEWFLMTCTAGDGYVKTYINGELIKSTSFTGNIVANTGDMYIGARTATDDEFLGNITKILIMNRTSSIEEIRSRYSSTQEFYTRKNLLPITGGNMTGELGLTTLSISNPPSACASVNSFVTYWTGSSATCTSINDSLVNANSSNYWDNLNTPSDITSLGILSSLDVSDYIKSGGLNSTENIILSSGKKVCLDGDSCSHYIYYNGSQVIIE